jgi:hypothetical protein
MKAILEEQTVRCPDQFGAGDFTSESTGRFEEAVLLRHLSQS